jgi:hypothetical protein
VCSNPRGEVVLLRSRATVAVHGTGRSGRSRRDGGCFFFSFLPRAWGDGPMDNRGMILVDGSDRIASECAAEKLLDTVRTPRLHRAQLFAPWVGVARVWLRPVLHGKHGRPGHADSIFVVVNFVLRQRRPLVPCRSITMPFSWPSLRFRRRCRLMMMEREPRRLLEYAACLAGSEVSAPLSSQGNDWFGA